MTEYGGPTIPWMERNQILDSEVPWWAFSMVHFERGSVESKVRSHILQGFRPTHEYGWVDSWYATYQDVVDRLFTIASRDPEEWAGQISKIVSDNDLKQVQHYALKSGPRSYVQWIGLKDDSNQQLVLKDFQVRVVNHLRQTSLVAVLIPFMHGKSELASKLVPLMDWSENLEATEVRVYEGEEFSTGWSRVMMEIVESHEGLHRIFPGVSKPPRGNKNYKVWSTDGFNIAGRDILSKDPSFRSTTWAKGLTGIRTDRGIVDDLVNDENDESVTIQNRIHNYLKTGLLTMRNIRPWGSRYGTKWGTAGLVGTIYSKQDANSRIKKEWTGKDDRKVICIDVFPYKDAEKDGVVIWPEKRPFAYIMQLKEELGDRAFRMRLRNQPGGDDGTFGFDEDDINAAVNENFEYGVVPGGKPCIIGFDPGSGKTTKYAKNPAFVVLCFTGSRIHFVAWGRWRGKMFPQQINELGQLATYYKCPIVLEDNNQQIHYNEQMKVEAQFQNVQIICMTTGNNKRDPVFGVEQWAPMFRNKQVVIHAGHAPRDELKALTREFINYSSTTQPGPGETTDLMMASWFARRQYELLTKHRQEAIQSQAPAHLSGMGVGRRYVNISRFKTANKGNQPWLTSQ